MRDRVLFSYHDTTLFASDPLTLNEGCWLNDSILSFYFEYLANEVLRGDTSVLFLKPAIVQLLRLQQDMRALRSALPPDLHAEKHLFIPINNGDDVYVPGGSGSHWSLLLYTPQPPSFHYFDSAANINYQVALEITHKLQRYLKKQQQQQQHIPITTHSCPQQENNSDCGIFVILFADLLARRYADLRVPKVSAELPLGYSMLANCRPEISQRMSPFALLDGETFGYRLVGSEGFARPVIEKHFYWIDYGDLCNPNRARAILRDLINQQLAKS